MTQIFTFPEQIQLRGSVGESRDDGLFSDSTSGGDGRAAQTGQVVAIAMNDFLDETELAQAPKLARDAGRRDLAQEGDEVGTADATDVELGTLKCTQQGLLSGIEEVEALEGLAVDRFGADQPMQVTIAGGKVVQCGEIFEVAAVTAEQDLAQVDEAVDGLSERGDLAGLVTIPMFHLAVVLEEGNVIGRGFQTQHPTELVVHLDRYLAEVVFDAGALDARREAAAEFLRQLRRDLLAQETGDLLGLDREDGLPGEFLVERLQDGVGAEHQIGRVFDLHQAPVIRLSEDIQNWAALLGVVVQKRMQGVWREGVRELLRPFPVGRYG
jgi:hypothetical protein